MRIAASHEQSRFPVTLWPASVLAPVPVARWSPLVLDHDGKRELEWRGPLEPKELPAEWVLRQLADTDLDDDDAVLELLGEYGVITWPYFDPTSIPPARYPLLAHLPGEDDHGDWWEHRDGATVEDARWWLKTARALAGLWREAALDGDPANAWLTEGFHPGLGDKGVCWAQFTLALNLGLKPYRAHAELTTEPGVTYGQPRAGLYSAACLQVFNLIVEEATARRCENATCGRVFVHQLGGSIYGQHRTKGLRFCSPTCARAETQRQYRRRRKTRSTETHHSHDPHRG